MFRKLIWHCALWSLLALLVIPAVAGSGDDGDGDSDPAGRGHQGTDPKDDPEIENADPKDPGAEGMSAGEGGPCVFAPDAGTANPQVFSETMTCITDGLSQQPDWEATAVSSGGNGPLEYTVSVDGDYPDDMCICEDDSDMRYIRVELPTDGNVGKIRKFFGHPALSDTCEWDEETGTKCNVYVYVRDDSVAGEDPEDDPYAIFETSSSDTATSLNGLLFSALASLGLSVTDTGNYFSFVFPGRSPNRPAIYAVGVFFEDPGLWRAEVSIENVTPLEDDMLACALGGAQICGAGATQ